MADEVVATDDEEFEPTKSKRRTRGRVAKTEKKPKKTGCKKELIVKLPITVEETNT